MSKTLGTGRAVPIYEVIEFDVEPEFNQRFFERKAHAESYAEQLRNEGLFPRLREHLVELNRVGICKALNSLVYR